MIIVDIKLRSANTGEESLLGRTLICNDGKGTFKRRNYDCTVGAKRDRGSPRRILEQPLRVSRVEQWDAKNRNVWRLVTHLLLKAFPEEQPRQMKQVSYVSMPFLNGKTPVIHVDARHNTPEMKAKLRQQGWIPQ